MAATLPTELIEVLLLSSFGVFLVVRYDMLLLLLCAKEGAEIEAKHDARNAEFGGTTAFLGSGNASSSKEHCQLISLLIVTAVMTVTLKRVTNKARLQDLAARIEPRSLMQTHESFAAG